MSEASQLAGNGALLVRERALATRVQDALERVYQIDRVHDVNDFLREADAGEREALLLRKADDGALEVTVQLPALGSSESTATTEQETQHLDGLCQIIEGVSHFVYVVERARTQRATTQLELEIQAEVDKWLVLAASIRFFDVDRSAELRARLYEHVSFEHDGTSELGERYRVANDAAHGFVRRLERKYVNRGRYREMRAEMRRFFQLGQEDKLRLAGG